MMRRSTFIAIIALLVAIAGTLIALAAYFKRKSCVLCDDFDDDMLDDDMNDLDYYATQVEDDEQEDVSEEISEGQAPSEQTQEDETSVEE